MKNRSNRLLALLLMVLGTAAISIAQVPDAELTRCASTERDSLRVLKNPALLRLRQHSEELIQNQVRLRKASRINADEIITIPVVVHLIHGQENQRIGGANNANITDAQVASQIEVLNEDYGNTSGYKGFYTDSLGVDTGIRFKLVTIVRTYNAKSQFSPVSDADELAEISPAWSTNRYLNIWVCRLNDRYLGTSQFPIVTKITSQTAGLGTEEDEAKDALTDGVIIDFRYFGRNSDAITSRIYNLGRTTTHEVGHWLGLIHIWGDQNCGTDYCADTPTAFTKNETTDTDCTPVFSNCRGVNTRNMIENYMDYSPDICMSMFTNDQKERMHAVMELSKRRAKLVELSKITTEELIVNLYPNPVQEVLFSDVYTPNFEVFTASVYNQKGQKVIGEALNRTSLNVKNLPSGIYFYKVQTASRTLTKRFYVR
ncbi:M43 family zinc metalloprotease [Dyadobacter sp. Leaf189]|uniref:M43 family zinc metalloprotease n=1 Tax=Dyadobacter sp. Leaf189 TaxID=1736295 RepID=UPI0006F2EA82|nr:M43 family zinc metalloprotease [Dyadobacter sp. Leaf189]KQS28214.1 metalloprotease [Dyadobacter sp. Leaf189]